MKIDLDDGIIKMANQAGGADYYLKLDVSNSNVSSKSDKPLKIGVDSDIKFSVDWDGTMRCKDAYINGARIETSSGEEIINRNGDIYGGMLKYDKKGNLLLNAGLVIEDGSFITDSGRGASLSFDSGNLVSTGGIKANGGITIGTSEYGDTGVTVNGKPGKTGSIFIVANGNNVLELSSNNGIITHFEGDSIANLDNIYAKKSDIPTVPSLSGYATQTWVRNNFQAKE